MTKQFQLLPECSAKTKMLISNTDLAEIQRFPVDCIAGQGSKDICKLATYLKIKT